MAESSPPKGPSRGILLGVVIAALVVLVWSILSGGPVAQPGDVNGDGKLDKADAEYLTNYIVAKGPKPKGSGDVNGDGKVDIRDVLYITNHLLAKGPTPVGWQEPTPTPVPGTPTR